MAVEGPGAVGYVLHEPQGHQQLVQQFRRGNVDGDGSLHTHDRHVDGPQAQLGQDTGQNGRDAAEGVQDTGDQACQHTRQQGGQHGDPQVGPASVQHHEYGGAGAEGAVHGQVGDVQNFIGDVDADGHDAPDQTLGYGTRQRVDEIQHDCVFPLFR